MAIGLVLIAACSPGTLESDPSRVGGDQRTLGDVAAVPSDASSGDTSGGGEAGPASDPDCGDCDVVAVPPIPELATWEARMLTSGAQFCVQSEIEAAIGSSGVTTEGNVWYYDGARVYEQVARYTGDPTWYTCADYSNGAYRAWVLAMTAGVSWPVGALNGWRIFPHGLARHHLRTNATESKDAVLAQARYSAFAESAGSADCAGSRETAYIIHAYILAERLGEARNTRLTTAVDYALGHLDGWFGAGGCTTMQPFMVGLTFEALIHYWQLTGDARIPPAVLAAADALWEQAWVAADASFFYDTDTATVGSPDLNLLIAPAYAWLWQRTGEVRHLQRGDAIFAGGALGATFWSGKQYSQSYRWSFDYVKWRGMAPGTVLPLTGF